MKQDLTFVPALLLAANIPWFNDKMNQSAC